MSKTPYQPISCELHSQFELFCMHHQFIEITTDAFTFKGIAKDIIVKNKEEFLSVEISTDKTIAIRLDSIINAKAMGNQ